MSFETPVNKALQSQDTAFGFWLTLPCAAIAKTILRAQARSQAPQFSWVLIDAEHGLITDKDYYELTNAVGSENVSPIIRVPWSEEWMIKRALDASAHGVVIPMCHTAEQARQIVSYCKYPPLGTRGYGPMFAAHSLHGVQNYDDGANVGLAVIVQIESKLGVDNVEKISKVDGVDVIFIGPFDLAKQVGVERGGPAHEGTIQRILRAAHSAGKKAAIFCTDGQDAQKRAAQGFDMISVATDVGVLGDGMIKELETARNFSRSDMTHTSDKRNGYSS